MKSFDLMIAVASWEERFELSLKRVLEQNTIGKVCIFAASEYRQRSGERIRAAEQHLRSRGVPMEICEIYANDPAKSWWAMKSCFDRNVGANAKVLFDISTCTREWIWYCLHALRRNEASICCVYSKPQRYSEWLSKDAGRPRLVYHHSGISKHGLPTALLVITGFDVERTVQLVNFYEPRQIFIGLEKGSQFQNEMLNIRAHTAAFARADNIRSFSLDTYSVEESLKILTREIGPRLAEYNLVVSSLGPKPSAITAFEFQTVHPETALAYVPSNRYHETYSTGLGEESFFDLG